MESEGSVTMSREEMIQKIITDSLEFFPYIKEGMSTPPKMEDKPSPKLTSLQFLTITYLHHVAREKKGIPMNILTKFLGISKQQTTKLVDSLVELEMVERYWNVDNRREVLVILSEKGEKHLKDLFKIREKNLTKKYEVLTDEELEHLMNLLNESLKILEKTRPHS